jgi:hypothetical protein
MKGKKILLHFGAVDWRTTVLINGRKQANMKEVLILLLLILLHC